MKEKPYINQKSKRNLLSFFGKGGFSALKQKEMCKNQSQILGGVNKNV